MSVESASAGQRQQRNGTLGLPIDQAQPLLSDDAQQYEDQRQRLQSLAADRNDNGMPRS
jgi:hypothetical protein